MKESRFLDVWSGMRLTKIILCSLIAFLVIPLLTHYYLTKVGNDSIQYAEEETTTPWLIQLKDIDKLQGEQLKFRIEELLRIKLSVSVELRDLEAKRQRLQTEISSFNRKLDEAKAEATHRRKELDRLQISLQQAKVAEKEAMERNTPRLGRPKPLVPLRSIPVLSSSSLSLNGGAGRLGDSGSSGFLGGRPEQVDFCQMDSCFDYSLCPISSPFSFYLYPLMWTKSGAGNESTDYVLLKNLHDELSVNRYMNKDNNPLHSCVFMIVTDICDGRQLARLLQALPNWFGDGRNHIVWLACSQDQILFSNGDLLQYFGRSMIVQQSARRSGFREKFDLVVSHWEKGIQKGEVWSHLPPLVPAKRKYLATYLGSETESFLQSEILKIQQEDPLSFVFQFSCAPSVKKRVDDLEDGNINGDPDGANPNNLEKSAKNLESYANKKLSNLCENEMLRTRLLIDSTFTLILLPTTVSELNVLSTRELQLRLHESLKFGAIPVVIGTRFTPPYDEVIDWNKILIHFPSSRSTELHYFLKSFTDSDLLGMRRNGRLVYEKYFSSMQNVAETVLGVIRTRIGLPPLPYKEFHLKSVFNDSFTPLKLDTFSPDQEDEENLGPIEPPYPSPMFARNYTTTFLQRYELWNTQFQPFLMFPFTPWDLTMPSEAKFLGSSIGFRPIGSGAGGSGKEFCESLGGNLPKEQFTVVMLTYEREAVLMNSLQRLYALPYLNKVVVVWNSPDAPSPDLKWPEIGVPVQIVKAEKNSLNNRFLPFDSIETEAVLSIDDDAHLRHDEIVFGFRVWRENRDRIVGFPGRFHAWDLNHSSWLYNSNYSCELSMVLTGAAFYHKMYSYLYTYEMPQAIRDKVDELMNCEDIAMNFLVSHVTQKPPVKVTSRWTFRCPGCPVTLSEDDSHFQERHHCINFFSKIYGYTPLLYTQFRADSVLFKTRIPHDKQKCFKYI